MTKRSYTYLVLAILALNCIGSAYAEKVLTGSKELPLEINLMIESLQKSSPENYKKILPFVLNIDLYARSMSKEDIFLIGKVEVYKTLLKNYATPIKSPVDGTTVATLRSSMSKTNDTFVKWFLQALLKDSLDLTSSPVYKEFLLQKNANVKNEKIEYRKLEKKAELIQFWVSKITPESLDSFTSALNPKMQDALKNIQNSFYLMAKEASMTPLASTPPAETDLKFFAVKDVAPVKVNPPVATGQKSVEDILAPITDISPADLPRPTDENWLEDENTPSSMQNLPKPSNDAEWLQDF
jgi:hypothetical protein